MKIRETTEKADNLIEQGEQAKQNQMRAQQNAMSARSQLHAAYAQLDAASETDEDGEPMGDVAGARAAIYAAQAMLQSAESDLANATRQIDAVNREKQETIAEIERYNEAEGRNVSVLQQLQSKRFGGNASKFAQDILSRMNAGENARQQLLASLGMSAAAKTYTMSGVTSPPGASQADPAFSQHHPESAPTSGKASFWGRTLFRKGKPDRTREPRTLNFGGLTIEQNGLLGDRYVVQGNNFGRYTNVLHDINDYTHVESSYKDPYITIRARDIEGVYLNENEALDSHLFWNRGHEYPVDSETYFLNVASHIPEVRARLNAGESVESIRSNPDLQTCYDYYFDTPIEVYEIDDYFAFVDAGRHRCMAAQKLGYEIPVKVIGKFDSIESLELQKMGVNKVHLSGCRGENRKAVLNATRQMFKDHPELVGQVTNIESKPIISGPGSRVFAQYGPTNYGSRFGGTLTVNSDCFSDPDFSNELTRLSTNGWFIPDATPESVVAHELGHGLHLELCALDCKVQNGSIPTPGAYSNVVDQYMQDVHAETIVERACSDLDIEFDSWDFSRELSKYGGANYGEAIAEAVSEVKCSKKPRPLAQAIYNHLVNYKKDLEGVR